MGKADGSVRTFFGVPFAQPPIGELRWRPPVPAPSWPNMKDATQFGSDCMQPSLSSRWSKAPGMSEDCLTLNIWAPAESQNQPLPVMFWIYGGGFVGGSASAFDGSTLARKGVIIVAANYRTGVFGFLAHPKLSEESENRVSGNYGLLDQIAALRWVQRNIAGIGGDPEAVTVFGESAGATSISLLLTSPLAKDLFSKAILQSPGAMRPLANLRDAEAAGSIVGSDLAAMRAMPAKDLLALTGRLVPAERDLTRPRAIGPIIDGWAVPTEEGPAYRSGAVARVPIIIGGNADEGRVFIRGWPIDTVTRFQTFVAQNFGSNAPQILHLYPAAQDRDVAASLSELFADTQFNLGIDGVANAMSSLGPTVYRYLFTHPVRGLSPTHGDEIPFVFGLDAAQSPSPISAGDQRISDAMVDAWTQFARSGDPNGSGVLWPRYAPASKAFLDFGAAANAKEKVLPPSPRLEFLDCIKAGRETYAVN
jgi:para-nitrobenzyl esterase